MDYAFENLNDDVLGDIDAVTEITTDINDDLNNHVTDSNALADNLERSIDVISALESLRESFVSKQQLSTDEIKLINIAAEMAVAGTYTKPNSIIPAMEAYRDISLEELDDVIKNALSGVLNSLGNLIKKEIDYTQASWTLIQFQNNRSDRLRARLNNITTNRSVSFNVLATKNTRYGNTVTVRDAKDYLKQFKETASFTSDLLSNVGKLAKGDLFSSLKTLVSPITGYDKNFKNMFVALSECINKATKLKGLKLIGTIDEVSEYHSDVKLGMSHLEINIPKASNYDTTNVSSMRLVYEDFYMTFVRDEKFRVPFTGKHILFDNVDKHYVEQLLDAADVSIMASRNFNTLVRMLSTDGARMVVGDAVVTILTLNILSGILKLMLSNYRLMLRTSMVIYNTNSSTFNFTRGNTAKALSICESAIKNLELIQ